MSKKADNATQLANKAVRQVEAAITEVDEVKQENKRLNKKVTLMKETLLKAECYQRRDNLVFEGIPEEKGETDFKCYMKIINALSQIEEI